MLRVTCERSSLRQHSSRSERKDAAKQTNDEQANAASALSKNPAGPKKHATPPLHRRDERSLAYCCLVLKISPQKEDFLASYPLTVRKVLMQSTCPPYRVGLLTQPDTTLI